MPRHIFLKAAPGRLFITSESVPGAPTLELPPRQEEPSGRDDDDAAGGQRPGECQSTLPAFQVHPLHQIGDTFCHRCGVVDLLLASRHPDGLPHLGHHLHKVPCPRCLDSVQLCTVLDTACPVRPGATVLRQRLHQPLAWAQPPQPLREDEERCWSHGHLQQQGRPAWH